MERVDGSIFVHYGGQEMTKEKFLNELKRRLKGLPREDIDSRIDFYSEMIDDRIESGLTEEEAVADIGSVDEVVAQIAKDTPFMHLVKEKVKPKRKISAVEIVLLIVCFPLWFPLAVTAGVLILVAYLLMWVGVIVTYAIEAALIATVIYGVIAIFVTGFNPAYLGATMVALGLAMIMLFACIAATKGSFRLTKRVLLSIKKKILTRGE